MFLATVLVAGTLCTMVRGSPAGFVMPGVPFIIARATADTIAWPSGGAGMAQVFDLERVGGVDVPSDFKPGARAVVVPWTYGPDCQPRRWTRSVQLARPGARHLFSATVRERARWINGQPTVDLYGLEESRMPPTWSGWTEDQAFELLQHLPTRDDIERNGWPALERLRTWARAHHELAGRSIVTNMLAIDARMAESHRLGASPLRARGTWEVVITLPSGRQARTWIRTATAPVTVGAVSFQRDDPFPTSDPWSYKAAAYSIHFWNAADSASLPGRGEQAWASSFPWEALERDSVVDGRKAWLGMIEIGSATWTSVVDPEMAKAISDLEQGVGNGRLYVPPVGKFTELNDGSLWFEQVVQVDSARKFTIRAKRVSLEAVPGNGYPRP